MMIAQPFFARATKSARYAKFFIIFGTVSMQTISATQPIYMTKNKSRFFSCWAGHGSNFNTGTRPI